MEPDQIHWNIPIPTRDEEDEHQPEDHNNNLLPHQQPNLFLHTTPATSSYSSSLPTSATTSESNSYSDAVLFSLLSSPVRPLHYSTTVPPQLQAETTDIVPTHPASEKGEPSSRISRKKPRAQSEQRQTQSQGNEGGLRPHRRTRSAEVHNISEKRRREMIREKIKTLQELIPGCHTSHRVAVLDAAAKYIKVLKRHVEGAGGPTEIPYMPQQLTFSPYVPMRAFTGFGTGMQGVMPTSSSTLFPSSVYNPINLGSGGGGGGLLQYPPTESKFQYSAFFAGESSSGSAFHPSLWGSGGEGGGPLQLPLTELTVPSSTFYYPFAGESSSGNASDPIFWGSGGGLLQLPPTESTFPQEYSYGNAPIIQAPELHQIPATVQRPTARRTSNATVLGSQLIRPPSFSSSQSAETPPLVDEETSTLMRR